MPFDPGKATLASLLSDFHETHERTYTFRLEDTAVDFVSYRLKARARVPRTEIRALDRGGRSADAATKGRRMVNFGDDGKHEASVLERSRLPPCFAAYGPVIVEEASSTTIVLPGQHLRVDEYGFLRISEKNIRE